MRSTTTLLATILAGADSPWPEADAPTEHDFLEAATLHGVTPLIAREFARQSHNYPPSLQGAVRREAGKAAAYTLFRERELMRILDCLATHNHVGLGEEIEALELGDADCETLALLPTLRGGPEVIEQARGLGGAATERATQRLADTYAALIPRMKGRAWSGTSTTCTGSWRARKRSHTSSRMASFPPRRLRFPRWGRMPVARATFTGCSSRACIAPPIMPVTRS